LSLPLSSSKKVTIPPNLYLQAVKAKQPPKPPMSTENSLKGTAERRNQSNNNNNSKIEEFKCPLCKFSTVDAVILQDHFSTSHPDPANPAPGAGSAYPGSAHSGSSSTSSTEVYI
jgi:hypothetical protein